MRRSGRLLFPGAILLAHVVLWLGLPSQNLHNDGLDEIMRLEAGARAVLARHPLAEPALQAVLQVLTALGYRGSAIRVVQVWNGFWMTIALAAVYVLARGIGRSTVTGVGAMLLLGGCYASLHLALDPYLYYLPPGIALMTLAVLTASRPARQNGHARHARFWGRWWLTLACMGGAVLFFPMSAAAIPVTVVGWMQKDRCSSVHRLLQALGLVLVPVGAYVLMLLATSGLSLGRGPYGLLSPFTIPNSLTGLSGALVSSEHGLGLPAALGGATLFRVVVALAAVAPPLVCILIANLRPTVAGGRRAAGPAWLCGAVVSAVFVAWWDPGQARFWLLPLWLLLLGWAYAIPRLAPTGHTTSRWPALVLAALLATEGAALAAANCAWYAMPAATRPDPRRTLALSMGRVFSTEDTLILPLWSQFHVDYFGNVRTLGLLSLHYARDPGQSMLDVLEKELSKTRRRGGSLFMEVGARGYPTIAESGRRHPGVDYAESDFRSIRWGRSREVAGHVFREVLVVGSGDPNG